jgi:protein-tyrosine phosphatase
VVDIHCHVLPGIDDGSNDLETSLAMLQMAVEAGTTDIVATPHANARYHFDPGQVRALISRLTEAGAAAPRLHYGCDFHLSFDNLRAALEHPERYTINHGRYLLVEFPDLTIFPNSGELLERLLERGMTPVITHPERNDWLRQRLGDLKAWVEMGCLLQLTAGSITGRFGKRAEQFCDRLFQDGLAHVVASDAHDTRHRTPDMREARKRISHNFGEAAAVQVFEDAPGAIVRNAPLPKEPPASRAKRRWYQVWR